jgi:hypothetical protein
MNVFPYEGYRKYTKQDIKNLLEDNANTNTLTDAEKSFLQDLIANPSQSVSGVASFNGRTGVVAPQSGDYTKAQVGLGNVDNTSDLNKPISNATQAALDGKVNAVATEIKALYESNADTNAYTTAEKTKLQGVPNNLTTSLSNIQTDIELLEANAGINYITGNSVTIGVGDDYSDLDLDSESVFIGNEAGIAMTSGTPSSVFIGEQSGKRSVVNPSGFWGTRGGLQNVGVGRHTLMNMTDGWFNTALGGRAAVNLTVGKACTALGHQALRDAVDCRDTVAIGEGALSYLTTGNGNQGIGLNAGLVTGMGRSGREHFIAGRINTVARDANNFPIPEDYYVVSSSNTWVGTGAGYRISGDNNVAIGSGAMYGLEEDIPLSSASGNTIVLHPNAEAIDGFYTPIVPDSYAFVITEGVGGGTNEGDTYYNSGNPWPDWAANTSVTAGERRVFNRVEPFDNANYRYMWVSKSTRTTGSVLNDTERSNWLPVCIEYFIQDQYRYYQVLKPVSYIGSTKTATVSNLEGGNIHTTPNSSSLYKYTQPPYRFKIISSAKDYLAFNNVAIGGRAFANVDSQNECVAVGWNSLSNMTTGQDTTVLGAYGFRFDAAGNEATNISRATGIGYNVRYLGNNTVVLGGVGDTVVLPTSSAVTSDERQKRDITALRPELGLDFITQLRKIEFKYDRDADYQEIDKETGNLVKSQKDGTKAGKRVHMGFSAQNVKSTLESLGVSPDDMSLYIDHSKNGGVDELAIRQEQIIACNSLAISQLNDKIKQLEDKIDKLLKI